MILTPATAAANYIAEQVASAVAAGIGSRGGAGGGAAPPPLPPSAGDLPIPPQDPSEALKSLEIDEDLKSALGPLFDQIGRPLIPAEVSDPGGESRRLLISKNGGASWYVISVHKCILETYTDKTGPAFSMLGYLPFRQNSKIHIISRDLDVPDDPFEVMREQWEKFRTVKVVFIEWTRLARLLRDSDSKKRFLRFQQIFKLGDISAVAQAAPQIPNLGEQERTDILRIMSAYAGHVFGLKPQDAMQNLILAADFPDAAVFLAGWEADVDFNSRRMLKWVKDDHPLYPAEHSRHGQFTLGWLLKALHDQNIDSDDKRILSRIIVDHNLLSDPDVVTALRTEVSG